MWRDNITQDFGQIFGKQRRHKRLDLNITGNRWWEKRRAKFCG
jgi:hypothetical protein